MHKTGKEILEEKIEWWKSYGFKEPSFSDLLNEEFKKENSGIIKYELIRKYSRSREVVNYFAGITIPKHLEDLIDLKKPEYCFIWLAENYLDRRSTKIFKEDELNNPKNLVEIFSKSAGTIKIYEEMLSKCLEGLRKKYGKRKVELLKKKFKI